MSSLPFLNTPSILSAPRPHTKTTRKVSRRRSERSEPPMVTQSYTLDLKADTSLDAETYNAAPPSVKPLLNSYLRAIETNKQLKEWKRVQEEERKRVVEERKRRAAKAVMGLREKGSERVMPGTRKKAEGEEKE